MRNLIALSKIIMLVTMTLALYILWMCGAIFVGRKPAWRIFIQGTWARAFTSLLGMRIQVVGPVPEKPFFLVSNHTGYVDIPALRTVTEGVFVAKNEISSWPVAGRIIRDMGNIFINRQSRRDIPRAGGQVKERLDEGEGVIVFAEGTSSDGKQVLAFHSSFLEFAAQSNLPVHYATVTYDTGIESAPASSAVAWADLTPLAIHMRNLFALKGFEATIRFGDGPIRSNDRKALARELHTAVETLFTPLK